MVIGNKNFLVHLIEPGGLAENCNFLNRVARNILDIFVWLVWPSMALADTVWVSHSAKPNQMQQNQTQTKLTKPNSTNIQIKPFHLQPKTEDN